MKIHRFHPIAGALALLGTLAASPARAQLGTYEYLAPASGHGCPPTVWFQALQAGQTGNNGHSGVVHLAAQMIYPGALDGAYLSWTAEGVFLTRFGGAIVTDEIFSPSGAPLTAIRGITFLASAFEVEIDAVTGATVAVTLHAGALAWDKFHTYLILIGGGAPTVEVFSGGAPLGDVRGIVALAGEIVDADPDPDLVGAALNAGALEYTSSKTCLTTIGGAVLTVDVNDPSGLPIPFVRGIQPMGGSPTPSLEAAAFLWTPTNVYLFLAGGTLSTTEILDPNGLPIAGAWGVLRQSPMYGGAPPFGGLVTIMTPSSELFVLVGGTIVTTEIKKPSGAPIASYVNVPSNNAWGHQASLLMQVVATWNPPTGGSIRGTVIGLDQ